MENNKIGGNQRPENQYMSVKYMGLVDGRMGVLSSKVALKDEVILRQPTGLSGKHSMERLLKSMKPDERRMQLFATPYLQQKDSRPILPSERKVKDKLNRERQERDL